MILCINLYIVFKIVDTNTERNLGPNQVGEIRLFSEFFSMNGFYDRDVSDSYDEKGWLKTGDLGYYDENNCIHLAGRCKDMLKYRSFKISPQKLEYILECHPAVDRAVVVGIPHHIDGEHPMAVVVLKNDGEEVSSADLKSFVDSQVEERLQLRGGIRIVEHIPLTSTGKPKRMELKRMLENTQV